MEILLKNNMTFQEDISLMELMQAGRIVGENGKPLEQGHYDAIWQDGCLCRVAPSTVSFTLVEGYKLFPSEPLNYVSIDRRGNYNVTKSEIGIVMGRLCYGLYRDPKRGNFEPIRKHRGVIVKFEPDDTPL